MNRKLRSNQGLTLVEMLVSVAVLAILMTGVFALMRSAAKYYSDSNKEVEIQNELQTAFNQISDVMVDATLGITYDSGTNKMTACHADRYYVLQQVDDKVYMSFVEFNGESDDQKKLMASTGSATISDEYIITDKVDTFIVDVTNQANGYVVLAVRLTYQNRTAYMSQNVFLRNSGQHSSDVGGGTPTTSGGATSTITPTVTTSTEETPTPTNNVPEATTTPAPTATPTPVWTGGGEESGGKVTVSLTNNIVNGQKVAYASIPQLVGNTITGIKPFANALSADSWTGLNFCMGDGVLVNATYYKWCRMNNLSETNFQVVYATMWFIFEGNTSFDVESVELTYK